MLTVLGGGPAGLAVAWYAKKAGIACTVFEAAARAGGNCVTFERGDFRFDSGAHRFHDKDAEITADVRALLGDELELIEVPSYVYDGGRFVDFPLAPLNLLRRLGVSFCAKATVEVLTTRLGAQRNGRGDFESFAVGKYGRTVASRFLLNYSHKLWGHPPSDLSPDVGGKRLQGLDLKSFLTEAIGGALAKDRHMDGRFWYPRLGYGRIVEALAEECGADSVRLGSRVSRIAHDRDRITAVEINGASFHAAEEVVSTLPLDLFLRLLDPPAPGELLELSRTTRYRNVVIAAFFLDRASITDAGTVYFPDESVPFTRVYEPRNRSARMAPQGQTSLVVEIPCSFDDAVWKSDDDGVLAVVRPQLERIGWIREAEVLGTAVERLPFAYPVLELGYEARVGAIHAYLSRFTNLRLSGRSGKFVYSWLHEMLRFGKDIVAEAAGR